MARIETRLIKDMESPERKGIRPSFHSQMGALKFAALKKSRRSIRSIDQLVKGYCDMGRLSRKHSSMTPIQDEGDRENGTTLFRTQNEEGPFQKLRENGDRSKERYRQSRRLKKKDNNKNPGHFGESEDENEVRYVQSNIDNRIDFGVSKLDGGLKICKTSVELQRGKKFGGRNGQFKKGRLLGGKSARNLRSNMKTSYVQPTSKTNVKQISASPNLRRGKRGGKMPLNSKGTRHDKWNKSKRRIGAQRPNGLTRSQVSTVSKQNKPQSSMRRAKDGTASRKRPLTAHPKTRPRPGLNSPRKTQSRIQVHRSKSRAYKTYDSSMVFKKKRVPKKGPRQIMEEARDRKRELQSNREMVRGTARPVNKAAHSVPRGPARSRSRPYTYRETPLFPEEEMFFVSEGVKAKKQEIMDTFAALNLDMGWIHKQSRNVDLDTGKGLMHFFELQNRLIVKLATKLRKEKNSRYEVEKQCQTMVDKFSKKI